MICSGPWVERGALERLYSGVLVGGAVGMKQLQ